MELQAREQVKTLLIQKKTSLTQLAQLLSEKTNKTYTLSSLSQKLSRGTLSYNEMLTIANVLNYKISFVDIDV